MPREEYLVVTFRDNSIRRFNLTTGEPVPRLEGANDLICTQIADRGLGSPISLFAYTEKQFDEVF